MTSQHDHANPPDGITILRIDGERVVRRTIVSRTGETFHIDRSFPSAIEHHYRETEPGKRLLMHVGKFTIAEDGSSKTFVGTIDFQWKPTPRIVAAASHDVTTDDIKEFLAEESAGIWATMATVSVDTGNGIPKQPADSIEEQSKQGNRSTEWHAVNQNLGHSDPNPRVAPGRS